MFARQRLALLIACSLWIDGVGLVLALTGVEVTQGATWWRLPVNLSRNVFGPRWSHELLLTALPWLLAAPLAARRWRPALIAAAAFTSSHWAEDWMVHEVFVAGHPATLGLWKHHFGLAMAVEVALCAAGIWAHHRWSRKNGTRSQSLIWTGVLSVLLATLLLVV